MVQRILLGQGIGLLDEDSKYQRWMAGSTAHQQYKRRVKRLVGVEREIAPDDSLSVAVGKRCRNG